MDRLVILTEEPSLKLFLAEFIPRFWTVPNLTLISFEGKQDLEKSIVKVLKRWREPNVSFIICRDKDSEDCQIIKKRLLERCHEANKKDVFVRILCHSLESWYLGDLNGLALAYQTRFNWTQRTRKYRNPDLLGNAEDELLKIFPHYHKTRSATILGQFLTPDSNQSHSFRVFVQSLDYLMTRHAN